ncbi:MAG: hypothetical protein IJD58_10635 [Lachnospiraceae bacterium]|nr:hypothetical protein [Lachnospiraceae bacterium]
MGYEIRKLWGNKIMLLGLLVLIFVSLYYGYENINSNLPEYVNMVDEAYKGKYTEEKLERLREKFANANQGEDEFFMYLSVCGEAEKCNNILEYRDSIVKAAKRLKKSSDTYISRVNSRIEKIYEDTPQLEIVEPSKFDRIVGMVRWQFVEDIISIMLVIFVASYIFTLEHGVNTHKLVFSSSAGRLKTYVRKIACIVGVAIGISIITHVCICAYCVVSGDSYIWKLPIQYYGEYIEAPYIISLLEYVIVTVVLKAIGLIVIGICSAVVSLWFKKSIIPVIISSVIMVGGYLLCSYNANYSPLGESVIQSRYERYIMFKKYTCMGLINNSGYYTERYMPVNVFDYPVDMVYVNIFINIIFVVAVAYAGYIVYRKRDR